MNFRIRVDRRVTGGGESESEVRFQLADYRNYPNVSIFDFIEAGNIGTILQNIRILCVRGLPRAISSQLIVRN